uniref:Phospholipase A2 n=1 Tax=Cyanistes caeruleus TaxID=156563 RepID=A0A8C0Z988_CYACU
MLSLFLSFQWEKHPYYNLTVKVLRARNIKGTDVLSKADCYVELKLPTASPRVSRTQVVDNSENPEWNETFQYRIHSAVKNILELTLYDKDVLVSDELTSIVFDLGGMRPGQPLLRTFRLNPEVSAWLSWECLQLTTLTSGRRCEIKVSVPGAYQKQLSIPWTPDNETDYGTSFVFHVDKEMCPELQVELEQTISFKSTPRLCVQKNCFSILITNPPKFHVFFLNFYFSTWDLDIRLGFDLCKEEREFLDKRKKVVSEALRKTLHLKESPPKDEVPVVAVLGSGGGMRALTSFYGSLAGLQQLGLLDAAIYLCGISGSTWCLSTLYQDPDWSQKDLQDAIRRAQDTVSSSKAGAFSPERLKYYFQELNAMEITGRKVSFTDLWGLIVEYFLQQKEDPSKLSDQQEAVKWAQNPYPIYAAVNVRPNISSGDFAEWCEFTPYEVGFRKYGAFVRTEDFDSEFFMGRLVQKHPEPRICFLQGMWGSAFAASLDDICLKVVGIGLSFLDSFKDVIKVVDDCRRFHFRDPARLKTRLVIPGGPLLQIFQDFFKSRVTCGETFNFMKGLYLHKDYVNIKEFVTWRGTHLDAFPNQLTPMEESLYFSVAADQLELNTNTNGQMNENKCLHLSWNHRMVWVGRDIKDLISTLLPLTGTVLELTQKYCEEREIPFPKIKFSQEDEEKPKECYMFVDENNPKAPIVLHFPLVNDTFQKYKAPGVERESEEEKSFGDFVIESKDSPYRTLNFTFEPYDFSRLVEVNRYSVLNNKDTLLKTLNLALQRRKLKKVINKSNT